MKGLTQPQTKGLAPRRLAWEVLQAVAAGAYADVALERALREHPLAGADRGLATELAYGAIRRRRPLDAWLDRLGKIPAAKQPPKLRWLLHVGLYQLLWMERIPASAAVNTAVDLAKAVGLARLAPVVNGMLRSALRAREAGQGLETPSDWAAALALEHSLPDWLPPLLLAWRGEQGAAAVAAACNQVPSLDLRVNPLRASRAEVMAALASAGISCHPIDGCPQGLQVEGHKGDLRSWPGYDNGHWCVQDRAQGCHRCWLHNQVIDLDASAAPGGKTTHLGTVKDQLSLGSGPFGRSVETGGGQCCPAWPWFDSGLGGGCAVAEGPTPVAWSISADFDRCPCPDWAPWPVIPTRADVTPAAIEDLLPFRGLCWKGCCRCWLKPEPSSTPPARFTRRRTRLRSSGFLSITLGSGWSTRPSAGPMLKAVVMVSMPLCFSGVESAV